MKHVSEAELQHWVMAATGTSWEHLAIRELIKAVKNYESDLKKAQEPAKDEGKVQKDAKGQQVFDFAKKEAK